MRVQLDLLSTPTGPLTSMSHEFSKRLIVFTAKDLQYARNIDLYYATGVLPSYYSAWDRGRDASNASIEAIATALSMPFAEVVQGLALRRADREYAITVRDRLIVLPPKVDPSIHP